MKVIVMSKVSVQTPAGRWSGILKLQYHKVLTNEETLKTKLTGLKNDCASQCPAVTIVGSGTGSFKMEASTARVSNNK